MGLTAKGSGEDRGGNRRDINEKSLEKIVKKD